MKRIKTPAEQARFLRFMRIYYVALLVVCPLIVIVNNHFTGELPTWQALLYAAIIDAILIAGIVFIGARLRELQDRK